MSSLLGSIPLKEFKKVYNQEIKHMEELVQQDDLDKPQSTTNMLFNVFDSFLAFAGNVEELHQQRPQKPIRIASEDNLLLPVMDMFLNAFLNLNNIPPPLYKEAGAGTTIMLKWHLAVAGYRHAR